MKRAVSSTSRSAALQPADAKWTWHHGALLKLRQRLLHLRANATQGESEARAAGGSDHEIHSTHEAVLDELCRPEDRLPEIDAALARIRNRSYGVCEKTGQPIPPLRLHAMPWIRCASSPSELHSMPA